MATPSWSVNSEHGHERQQDQRRERREREQDLARGNARRVDQRVYVLEVPVRRPVRAVGHGIVERHAAVQEGVGLPHEVGVLVVVDGVRPRVQRERAQRQEQPQDEGRGAGRDRLGRGGPAGALGYTPVHLQTLR
jgi:hypothetical protein